MDFEHTGFFALRTTLLPFEEFLEFSADLEAAGRCGPELDPAWKRDMDRLRDRLRRILRRPEVRDAIAVASPDLESRARVWCDGDDGAASDDLVMALARYFVRMSARSTPFGLFAGTAVGRIGGARRLRLAERARYRRHTRLDMDYLSALVQALRTDAGLRGELTYRPNSSLYEAAGRARYFEARMAGRERRYHLVALELDAPLAAVLARARDGATRTQLQDLLARDDITAEEAAAYVDELIDAQVLVSDLEPCLTGDEALEDLVRSLAATPSGQRWTPALEQVGHELGALDADGLGVEPERYRRVATTLATLPPRADLARLFQVDLVKPVDEASLPASVLGDVERGLEALLRLQADVLERESESLARFREQFTERYGEREVPLLEVLDEEVGIGFNSSTTPNAESSPLLAGLVFPSKPPPPGRSWSLAHGFILPHLSRALASAAREIVLEPRDLDTLPPADFSRLPDALAVMLKLFSVSPGAASTDDHRVWLQHCSGPSGARLLGRFCHMDVELREHVRRHAQREETLLPDAVFAEIAHLPEGRIGNILARPLLRDYEIPFLGRSGAPVEHQIAAQDLHVSVCGNRIVLRSARLGREVVPRLSTAHNFNLRTVRVYQFLCRLQSQFCTSGLQWSWGPLERQPFLPSIRLGRVVLEPARWVLDADDIQATAAGTGAQRFEHIQKLREARAMPRCVGLVDGDNVLPIDLDNALGVAMLVDLIAKRPFCILREIEASTEQLVAEGPEGHFVHEIVLPLVRRSSATSTETKARSTPQVRAAPNDLARLGPGSNWLYYKLYTGAATAEGILREELPELVQECREMGAIDRWFFLRFGDPRFHLRIRLRAAGGEAAREIQARAGTLWSRLVSSGRIWKLQLDTYDPEQARYGGRIGLDLAERLFEVDSDAALDLVKLTAGDAGADMRWRLCLAGMDRLLEDLGFDVRDKHAIMVASCTEFGREFGVEGRFKRQIRDRYRVERPALETVLAGRNGGSDALAAGLSVLQRRSLALQPIAGALHEAARAGALDEPLQRLASHYLHMHANRVSRSAPRAQEAVIYQFLERLYESALARRLAAAPAESGRGNSAGSAVSPLA